MRRHLRTLIVALLISAAAHAQAAPRFKAVAFDNFVIFNPNSVAPEVEKAFPGKGTEFTKAWRAKQFEYGFLRSIRTPRGLLQGHRGRARLHRCRDAAPLPPEVRQRLLNAYLSLQPWPEAVPALRQLKAAGVRIITIANFSGRMLRANAEGAGIVDLFDELLSTE